MTILLLEHPTLPIALTSLVLLTSACDDYDYPHCEETVIELDGVDAITPSGHSVAAILATIEGERETELAYPEPHDDAVLVEHNHSNGEPTTLSVSLSRIPSSKLAPEAGGVRWVESEEVYPTSGAVAAIAIECPDRLEIDARLGFSTLDGAFDELVDVTVRAALDWNGELSYAQIQLDYDPEELDGDLRIESIEPDDAQRVDHSIQLSYALTDEVGERDGREVGEPFGSVGGGAEHSGGDWVSYGMFTIAAFGGYDPAQPW